MTKATCLSCDDRPGEAYTLRIRKLSGEEFDATLVLCAECAGSLLDIEWVERRSPRAKP